MSKPAHRSARLGLGVVVCIIVAAGCGSTAPTAGPPPSPARSQSVPSGPSLPSVASVSPGSDPAVPVTVESGFPSKATTGVPEDVDLKRWTGRYQTSQAKKMPTETVDGRACKLFEGYWFDLADTGNYLYVNDPCVVLRRVRITTNGVVSNTSAMVQQGPRNSRLLIEDSDFDGGPHHQRGVQADYGGVTVRGSSFTRFGNAAVEMNDTSAKATFEMDGNYLYEPGGWNRDDHVDGFQVGAGGAVTINNNTVLVEPYGAAQGDDTYVSNSALGLWAELGDVTGPVVVDHNLLAGGGFVMYLEQKSPYQWLGQVSVTNNVFDERFSRHGGIWGPLADSGLPRDLVWSGNTWNDGAALDLTSARG